MNKGYVTGWPRVLLRMEGIAVLLCAVLGYRWSGQSWWMFAVLVLVPDASMLGYLGGNRLGALAYNMAHTLAGPLLVLCSGVASESHFTSALALIWLAHIGIDRAVGYGLKYESGFGDTHLGSLNENRVERGVRFCRT